MEPTPPPERNTDECSAHLVDVIYQAVHPCEKGEPERYHAEWMKRSREAEYDYSSFVQFLEAINDSRFPREIMERMVDVDMMAANAVVRGGVRSEERRVGKECRSRCSP